MNQQMSKAEFSRAYLSKSILRSDLIDRSSKFITTW